MQALLSFTLATLLAGLDIALLALVVRRLGASVNRWGAALLALAVAAKLGLLVMGMAWLLRQPWADRRALLAGLLAPFVLFVGWQALRLRTAKSRVQP